MFVKVMRKGNVMELYKEVYNSENANFLNQDVIDSLGPTTYPIMILDRKFNILRMTKASIKLFSDYYNLTIKNFFDIFENSFASDVLNECQVALQSKENGFSWSGIIGHKSHIAKSIYTKLTFIPLFLSNILQGYFVIFENVTKEFITHRMNVLQGLLKASKMKDKDTSNHTLRVNYYSKLLAKYMHQKHMYPNIVNFDFVENIGLYASMHDIGKIGTPDYILHKPRELNDTERTIMQEHTINGAMILSSFELPMAQDIAISHHERWDGSGYPFRIANSLIPLAARIVSIADVYDALREKRPYKDFMSHDTAIEMIIADSETHFDPELIKILKKIHPYFDKVWEKLKDKEDNLNRMEHL